MNSQKSKHPSIFCYTAITGGKDAPRDDIPVFSGYDKFKSPVMNAKIYKVLAHKFTDKDISIWMDGNIFLEVEPEKIVEEFLEDADIALWRHFKRDGTYQESAAVKHMYPDKKTWENVDDQERAYAKDEFDGGKLAECNVIIRRHNKATEEFNVRWWAEICRHSRRDQLSFPYVAEKMRNQVKINYIVGNPRCHPYFDYHLHEK